MKICCPARTQCERADQTRARILAAAIRQFSEYGLAGARTEQIAEEAGVNKALIYYYFQSKEKLYVAAMESAFEEVRIDTEAILSAETSAGERLVQMTLNNFDRAYSHPSMRTLMQQEMVRLHQGEENQLAAMAQKFFRPLWCMIQKLLEDGITSGELIPVDPQQIRYTSLGANVFYFLTAPLTKLAFGINPMEKSELEYRRKASVEYLGQAIFVDREHGARVAARVLAATPMPPVEVIDNLWPATAVVHTDQMRRK
jgi:TetR/AcrR family transcriptional regulator